MPADTMYVLALSTVCKQIYMYIPLHTSRLYVSIIMLQQAIKNG